MSEQFFQSNRPGYPHPVSSELENSGIRVAVGDCSVTECRRWRLPYQTGKTVHVHAKTTNTKRTEVRRQVCVAMVPYHWATRGTSLQELEYTHTLLESICEVRKVVSYQKASFKNTAGISHYVLCCFLVCFQIFVTSCIGKQCLGPNYWPWHQSEVWPENLDIIIQR